MSLSKIFSKLPPTLYQIYAQKPRFLRNIRENTCADLIPKRRLHNGLDLLGITSLLLRDVCFLSFTSANLIINPGLPSVLLIVKPSIVYKPIYILALWLLSINLTPAVDNPLIARSPAGRFYHPYLAAFGRPGANPAYYRHNPINPLFHFLCIILISLNSSLALALSLWSKCCLPSHIAITGCFLIEN